MANFREFLEKNTIFNEHPVDEKFLQVKDKSSGDYRLDESVEVRIDNFISIYLKHIFLLIIYLSFSHYAYFVLSVRLNVRSI